MYKIIPIILFARSILDPRSSVHKGINYDAHESLDNHACAVAKSFTQIRSNGGKDKMTISWH